MPPSSGTTVLRVAVIAHRPQSLFRFRGGLVRALLASGAQVLVMAPGIDQGEFQMGLRGLQAAGGRLFARPFPLAKVGSSAFSDRAGATALGSVLGRFKPNSVIASGPRSAVLGALAGRECGASHVTMILNGVAAMELDHGAGRGWIGGALSRRRRLRALQVADLVVVHAAEHHQRLIAEAGMAPDKPCLITPGSGIDLGAYPETLLPPIGGGLVFLMAAPLGPTSGAATFLAAARLVRARSANTRFLLAGAVEEGGLKAAELTGAQCPATYLGHLRDVRSAIADAHVVVHPAVGEGAAGIALEAMSMGRPVVVADDAGGRQVVTHGGNGLVVAPGDVEELAGAMTAFLKRPDLLPRMAREARAKAVAEFDERRVVAVLLDMAGLQHSRATLA